MIALVDSTSSPGDGSDSTVTPDINSTTADFLLAAWTVYRAAGAPVLSDSRGNSGWFPLPNVACSTVAGDIRLSFCKPTSVGPGHSAMITVGGIGYAPLFFGAFSGLSASPYNGDQLSATEGDSPYTVKPGALTPPRDGCLIVTFCGHTDSTTEIDIDAPFTRIQHILNIPSVSFGGALAIEIQTVAALRDPIWGGAGSTNHWGLIASFSPASGIANGGAAARRIYENLLGRIF